MQLCVWSFFLAHWVGANEMTLQEINALLAREDIEPVRSSTISSWLRAGWLPPVPLRSGRREFDLTHLDRVQELAVCPRRHQRGRPPKQNKERAA